MKVTSVVGTKQTCRDVRLESAFTGKADVAGLHGVSAFQSGHFIKGAFLRVYLWNHKLLYG
jgi:hypothetical protein